MGSPGWAAEGTVGAGRLPLLLTSRRHIDLLRVCSAAHSPCGDETAVVAGA